jgi:hypothetical protein
MSLRSRCSVVLIVFGTLLLTSCSLVKPKGDSGKPSSSSSSSGNDRSSSSSDNPSRGITSFAPSDDARKDVRDALAKLNTAYPYRLTEVSSMSGNGQNIPESTRVVEFAAAHRSHMKWTGGQAEDVEAITIGDKHYWFSNGKWTEGTVPERMNRGADFVKKLADMVREVKYVGPESVNGESCYVYTGTFEMTLGGQQWTGTAKVWIGSDDGLIHQSDSDYKVANYSGKSHLLYEYNVNIKVEPPAM